MGWYAGEGRGKEERTRRNAGRRATELEGQATGWKLQGNTAERTHTSQGTESKGWQDRGG